VVFLINLHSAIFRNGEDWYRLRSATQQAMLRPTAVEQYLPLVNKAALALVDRISKCVGSSGAEVEDLRDLVGKWSLECSSSLKIINRNASYYFII
jgi:cytochrome P450